MVNYDELQIKINEHFELMCDEEYNIIVEKVNEVKWKNKSELSEKERFIKNKLWETRKKYQEGRSGI